MKQFSKTRVNAQSVKAENYSDLTKLRSTLHGDFLSFSNHITASSSTTSRLVVEEDDNVNSGPKGLGAPHIVLHGKIITTLNTYHRIFLNVKVFNST